jgi:hypothetical protein
MLLMQSLSSLNLFVEMAIFVLTEVHIFELDNSINLPLLMKALPTVITVL